MSLIPPSISRHRPSGFGTVDIRNLRGYYYVYRTTSVWDPVKKRPRKKTLPCIGKIVEGSGFIPNREGLRLIRAREERERLSALTQGQGADGSAPPQAYAGGEPPPKKRNYGAYEVLRQLNAQLGEQLRQSFPDICRRIEAHALLCLVDGACTSRSFRPAFWNSYLRDECPDLPDCPASVCRFIAQLGLEEARCEEFMRSFYQPGTTVFYDGTAFFTRSQDTLAHKGYNPRHRADPQARLLYAFDRSTHRPVFYQVLQGNTVDRTTFLHAVKAAGCTDCLVVADKGFYSKKNLGQLRELGLSYILPLQHNSTLIPRGLCEHPSSGQWHGAFAYHERALRWHMSAVGELGNSVYVFFDETRHAQERSRHVAEHASSDAFDERGMGCMAFITNLRNLGAEDLYLLYKERWDIEECFDRLKNKINPHASYAHGNEFTRGWSFINHVALMYYYGLVNALREKGLNRHYTPEDVIRQTRDICLWRRPDGTYELNDVFSETQKILDTLEISLLREK